MTVVQVEKGFLVEGEAESSVDACGLDLRASAEGFQVWGCVRCEGRPCGEVEFEVVVFGVGEVVMEGCWRWVVGGRAYCGGYGVVYWDARACVVMGWCLVCVFVLLCILVVVAVVVARVCDHTTSTRTGHDTRRIARRLRC